MVEQCTQRSAVSRGGSGSQANVISVKNASVPSEPASSRQKLKVGQLGVKACSPPASRAHSRCCGGVSMALETHAKFLRDSRRHRAVCSSRGRPWPQACRRSTSPQILPVRAGQIRLSSRHSTPRARYQVLACAAIDNGVGAAGVVADHASDHAAVLRGGFGREKKAVRNKSEIEFIADNAGLDTHAAPPGVDLQNAGQVTRHIDHDPDPTTWPASEVPAVARYQRGAVFPRKATSLPISSSVFGRATACGISR